MRIEKGNHIRFCKEELAERGISDNPLLYVKDMTQDPIDESWVCVAKEIDGDRLFAVDERFVYKVEE